MAELTTLARPYARAAFEFARDQKELGAWSVALKLVSAITAQKNFAEVLASPKLTASQKSQTYIDVCGDSLSTGQQNFIRTLASYKRLSLLPQISGLFELYKANQEKTVEVEVESAFAIDNALIEKLKQALSKKLDRAVNLQTSVDKNLIGGALIRAGDTVIDGSIRGRLAKLAEAIGA